MRSTTTRALAVAAALTIPAVALAATAPAHAAPGKPDRPAAEHHGHRGRLRAGRVHRERRAVRAQPVRPRGHPRGGRLQRRPVPGGGGSTYGTATPGVDYVAFGTFDLTFQPGQQVARFKVKIKGDTHRRGQRGDRRPLRRHRVHRRRQRHRPGDRQRRRRRQRHQEAAAAPAEPDHARARHRLLRLQVSTMPVAARQGRLDGQRRRLHHRAAAGPAGRDLRDGDTRAATTRPSASGPSPSPGGRAWPTCRSRSAATPTASQRGDRRPVRQHHDARRHDNDIDLILSDND